jgi:sugar phosphate permease
MGILVLVTIRNQPENMGLRPLGADDETQKEQNKRGRNIQEWQGIPLKTLRKRPYFYLTIAGMFLAAFMTYAIYPTIVSHMQDNGMTQTEAAQVQSIMFLLLSGAKILEGWLSDRIGARRVMVFSVICGIVAALILADVRTQAGAFAGVAVLSFVLTVSTIMVPVLTADVFGSIGYGSVLGIMLAVIRLATGTATTVANAYFDLTGSYHGMYLICAGMGVTALLLFMAAFRGAEKERAKVSAEQAE